MFSQIPPSASGIHFANPVDDKGEYKPYNTLYIYNGGGVAAGDLDNDGWIDLVFTSNQHPAAVYRNKGNMEFEDITASSGVYSNAPWATGVTMADVNSDGWLDIYICRSGSMESTEMKNLLFINNKDGTFTESGSAYGLDDNGGSIQAYFFDYDNDSDLDAYIVNHPTDFKKATDFYYYTRETEDSIKMDKLFENMGGRFVDVTASAGLGMDVGFGLSASINDVNGDGYMDIFVANDFFAPDRFYINNGDKTFRDAAAETFQMFSLFSMGSEFGDINNDGNEDLLVVDMAPFTHERLNTHRFALPIDFYTIQHTIFDVEQRSRNMLFLNQGGQLNDIGEVSGISRTEWSWSAFIEDLDLDGLSDVLITNGLKKDLNDLDFSKQKFNDVEYYKRVKFENANQLIDSIPRSVQQNRIFRNLGELNFQDVSEDWDMPYLNSQGAAIADLDNDGDPDLVFNNTDTTALIMRNEAAGPGTEHIRLELTDSLNTHGIGAKVSVYRDGSVVGRKSVIPSRGYQSCSPYTLVFAWQESERPDSLVVFWPNLRMQSVPIGSSSDIVINSRNAIKTAPQIITPLFERVASSMIKWKHQEDDFNDFYRDKLSPFLLSRGGPPLQVKDMNGDGLVDLVLPGTDITKVAVYYQRQDGTFEESPLDYGNAAAEISDILTEDLNSDGLPDILIVRGGNAFPKGSEEYRPMLLLNERNNWRPCPECLPDNTANVSVVRGGDIDADGDIDLFIGGRGVPMNYGKPAEAQVWRNESGKFVPDESNSLFEKLGMVTDAAWQDMNNDGFPELIITGDWMQPLIYDNYKGKLSLSDKTSNAPRGLWRCLEVFDYDGDGDSDILLGNLGTNCLIKAGPGEAVELVGGDFDKNDVYESLMFHYVNGEKRIYQNMDEYCKTMPFFFNEYFNNKDFAAAEYSQLVPEGTVEIKLTADELRSGVLINEGKSFQFKAFENELQLSPINDFFLHDLDDDGQTDIIIVGNNNTNHYLLGDITANPGTVLVNRGKGNYDQLDHNRTGLGLRGDVRSTVALPVGNDLYFVFGVNNDSLAIYKPSGF